MSNDEWRGEITRKHKRNGKVYEVKYLDLRGIHPMDRRKLEWLAFASGSLRQAVADARLDLMVNGWQ
ncbi:MAG: hypothetical protein AABZ76_07255 [Pseudomonadota bacterium]